MTKKDYNGLSTKRHQKMAVSINTSNANAMEIAN